MKQETIKEAKFNSYKEFWNEYHTQLVKSNFLNGFENGAKWQQERMYNNEEMMEYAKFCIYCYEQGLPNIMPNDWKNLYKNDKTNS